MVQIRQKLCLIAISLTWLMPLLCIAERPTKQCVLSADFGTESCRVGLFDIESGKLIDTSAVGYETKFPENGFAEQNPIDWWTSFAAACEKIHVSIDNNDLVGICIDTTACSVVSLDANFNPLRPCLLWMDTRSAAEAKDMIKLAKGDPALQVNCGGEGPISAEWMIPKAMWLKRHCNQWPQTKYLCEKQDYLNYLLTGEYCASGCNVAARWHWNADHVCNTDSSSSFSSIIEQKKFGRPVSLLQSLDMEELLDHWPVRCVPMGGLVGYLTQKAATTLHLPVGIPVYQGGPDAYVGMIGLGLAGNRPDVLALVTGSSHLHLTLTTPCVEGGKGYWGPYHGAPLLGQSFAEGGQSSTGSVLAWLRRLLNGQSNSLSYQQLDEEASVVPIGSDGLLSLATFQGSRTPRTDPKLRGAFIGLSLAHSRGHLWRACLEGVCFGTRAAIEALPQEQSVPDDKDKEPIILAGGVSRSPLWLQMTADITNRSVITAEMDNSPLIGGSILAAAGHHRRRLMREQQHPGGEASAISSSVRELSMRFIKEKQPIVPNQTAVALYDLAYKRYVRMTAAISPVCRVNNPAAVAVHHTTVTTIASLQPQQHQLVPSLLAADGGHLFQEATRSLSLGVKAFHLDICDGGADCGGSLTLGTAAAKAVQQAISSYGCAQNEIMVEVHLVADYSLSLLQQLAAAGTTRLILQVERLQQLSDQQDTTLVEIALPVMKLASSLGMEIGLCLAPQTDVTVLDPLLNLEWSIDENKKRRVQHVNILCVHPGFGGQSFNHSCLSKVQYLHQNYLTPGKLDSIGVDGGVSKQTLTAAMQAGATVLVAGTSLFGTNREYPDNLADDPFVTAYVDLVQLIASVSSSKHDQ